MDLQKLTDEELNTWHFELSKDSFEIMSRNGSLIRFYEIENQMVALRREWLRRIKIEKIWKYIKKVLKFLIYL
jgi:hypothetical protein